MKKGIVLEGGALRAIFSSGVCDALLEQDVMPDYLVGVSAGIAYGVSYLSRQPRRNLKVVTTYAPDKRYMGIRNLADKDNRCYFGLKFAYDTIPNQLIPFDYDAFAAYPGQVEAVVTNLNTGKAEYFPVPRRDRYSTLLQATCAMPLMFPIFHLGGQPYLDGGIADAIPWKHALEQGCDPAAGGADPPPGLCQEVRPHAEAAPPDLSGLPQFPACDGAPGPCVQREPGGAVPSGAPGEGEGHPARLHHGGCPAPSGTRRSCACCGPRAIRWRWTGWRS